MPGLPLKAKVAFHNSVRRCGLEQKSISIMKPRLVWLKFIDAKNGWNELQEEDSVMNQSGKVSFLTAMPMVHHKSFNSPIWTSGLFKYWWKSLNINGH